MTADARLSDWALRHALETVLDDLIEHGQTEDPTDWRTNTIFDLVEARDLPEVYLARQRAVPGSRLALWQGARRAAIPKPEASVLTLEDFVLWRQRIDRLHVPLDDTADPQRQKPERTGAMDDPTLDRAKRGYQAYGAFRDWKNYAGLPMPAWDELRPEIQEAWRAATVAILSASDDVGYPLRSEKRSKP